MNKKRDLQECFYSFVNLSVLMVQSSLLMLVIFRLGKAVWLESSVLYNQISGQESF